MEEQVQATGTPLRYWLVFRGHLDPARPDTEPDPTTELRMGPFRQIVLQLDAIAEAYGEPALAWLAEDGGIDGWRPRGTQDLWFAVEVVAEVVAD